MKNRTRKDFADKFLILEGSRGASNTLLEVKTNKRSKKEIENKLRINLDHWLKNKNFDNLRKLKFDLAIIIYVNQIRFNKQDLDNIAKVVLDSLKKSRNEPKAPFLFEDDSQIIRLLLYKIRKSDIEESKTDSIVISFREHNPKKQMILTTSN